MSKIKDVNSGKIWNTMAQCAHDLNMSVPSVQQALKHGYAASGCKLVQENYVPGLDRATTFYASGKSPSPDKAPLDFLSIEPSMTEIHTAPLRTLAQYYRDELIVPNSGNRRDFDEAGRSFFSMGIKRNGGWENELCALSQIKIIVLKTQADVEATGSIAILEDFESGKIKLPVSMVVAGNGRLNWAINEEKFAKTNDRLRLKDQDTAFFMVIPPQHYFDVARAEDMLSKKQYAIFNRNSHVAKAVMDTVPDFAPGLFPQGVAGKQRFFFGIKMMYALSDHHGAALGKSFWSTVGSEKTVLRIYDEALGTAALTLRSDAIKQYVHGIAENIATIAELNPPSMKDDEVWTFATLLFVMEQLFDCKKSRVFDRFLMDPVLREKWMKHYGNPVRTAILGISNKRAGWTELRNTITTNVPGSPEWCMSRLFNLKNFE